MCVLYSTYPGVPGRSPYKDLQERMVFGAAAASCSTPRRELISGRTHNCASSSLSVYNRHVEGVHGAIAHRDIRRCRDSPSYLHGPRAGNMSLRKHRLQPLWDVSYSQRESFFQFQSSSPNESVAPGRMSTLLFLLVIINKNSSSSSSSMHTAPSTSFLLVTPKPDTGCCGTISEDTAAG